ncbi:MAG: DHH family phosphoesterase [Spirochaetota bacterium]
MDLAQAEDRELFRSILEKSSRIVITTHSNPDPDAIASSYGMLSLVRHLVRRTSIIVQSGSIGRAENRSLIEACRIKLTDMRNADITARDTIILVDAQHPNSNYPLPKKMMPRIVIDHHPLRAKTYGVPYHDIRPSFGSTATIIYEYLTAFEVPVTKNAATALFYGIKTDTADLSRGVTNADIAAHQALVKRMDHRRIAVIENAPLPLEYYREIFKGLSNAMRYENIVIVHLHSIPAPDYASLIADFFLRCEKVNWVLVSGRSNEHLILSLRSKKVRRNAGEIIKSLTAKYGSGGGHGAYAAGTIPLMGKDEDAMEKIERDMVAKLLTKLAGRVMVGERFFDAAT